MKTLIRLMFVSALSVSAHAANTPLKVIELYTSHGCSSCPPAERLLGDLLEHHSDLLALEFHVDYWNSLVHGSDGNFVDPYSDEAYSLRQREYNAAGLKGRPGVYTPQAVVNGRVAAIGSSRRHIERALSQGQAQSLDLQIDEASSGGDLQVTVTGEPDQLQALRGINIVLARYIDKATTTITGGENRHRELENRHIVTGLQSLGSVAADRAMIFSFKRPAPDSGCVVLVQKNALSPVYAAAACP